MQPLVVFESPILHFNALACSPRDMCNSTRNSLPQSVSTSKLELKDCLTHQAQFGAHFHVQVPSFPHFIISIASTFVNSSRSLPSYFTMALTSLSIVLIIVSAFFPILSGVLVTLRIRARKVRKYGIGGDDWWIIAALVCPLPVVSPSHQY
jgi:hypothetical protein